MRDDASAGSGDGRRASDATSAPRSPATAEAPSAVGRNARLYIPRHRV